MSNHKQGVVYARRVYGNWALGSWKKVIIEVFSKADDLAGLKRVRFNVDLGGLSAAPNVAELAFQEALALELHLMIMGQVMTRTVEGFLSSYVMPASLAALTIAGSNRAEIKEKWIRKMRASLAAFRRYQNVPHDIIQKMTGRHFFASGLGLLVRTILEFGNQQDLDTLVEYLCLLFSGPGMTKINEDANRYIKE